MSRAWNCEERKQQFEDLQELYVQEGKSISCVGNILGIAGQTVFQRLKYFGIPSNPKLKRRQDVIIPASYSENVAEFFGVMLGDGKLSYFQVIVNLGTKESEYAHYLCNLIASIFGARPKISLRKNGYRDVYLGSVDITSWLSREGLVYNKVLSQVDAPKWIFREKAFINAFLRGFFDTDGSVYRLRWGTQISFTSKSIPLLKSVRNMLIYVGYTPSRASTFRVYLTRRADVFRFFREIQPRNPKHLSRFSIFKMYYERAGTEVAKRGAL